MIEFSSEWVASIPSPSFNSLDVGPLTFTLYGLMIGLGIIAATTLARSRSPERNLHPDTPVEMLVWVVPAGLIGTRIYHIITDWVPISQWHKIWEGGLGIPGGIMAGAVAGVFFTKHRGLSTAKVADVVAPSLPLAQAIGRIGNWWNQELYGRPTDLPWGLEIDADHRRPGFEEFETFHPTFLYETLWNLGLVGFLLWLDRKRVLKPGRLIWMYAAGYAIGRLWIESVRIDNATEVFGARINLWIMGIVLAVSLAVLSKGFRSSADEDDAAESAASEGETDDSKADTSEARAATTASTTSRSPGSTKTAERKERAATPSTERSASAESATKQAPDRNAASSRPKKSPGSKSAAKKTPPKTPTEKQPTDPSTASSRPKKATSQSSAADKKTTPPGEAKPAQSAPTGTTSTPSSDRKKPSSKKSDDAATDDDT